jgi:hypothetical protein
MPRRRRRGIKDVRAGVQIGPPRQSSALASANGCEKRVATLTTLAELFAIQDGAGLTAVRRRPVGFAPS